MRVLVVEDEKKMASFIRKALMAEGFATEGLQNGTEVLPMAATTAFDVIILDVMLPGQDGLATLRELRARGIRTPVLMLTARGQVTDRVEGLNAGADDYLPKPFALAELIARVRALSRRVPEARPVNLSLADLVMNTVEHKVTRAGKAIELTPREYRLLEFLLRAPGRVCSRMAIIENVWDYDFDPGTNLVDVYIMRLREKIDQDSPNKLLHTIRGVGYVMKETR